MSNPATPAWRAVAACDGPGYHYEFAYAAIVALARGLPLAGHVQAHPGLQALPGGGPPAGAPVRACCTDMGLAVLVAGVPWLFGDAFDVGREFYALVGFNEAPWAAYEAIRAQAGEAVAAQVAREADPLPR